MASFFVTLEALRTYTYAGAYKYLLLLIRRGLNAIQAGGIEYRMPLK